jgi:hypothetical protein
VDIGAWESGDGKKTGIYTALKKDGVNQAHPVYKIYLGNLEKKRSKIPV